MGKILIGKIVNVVGLKGEVKVYNYSDSIDIYVNAPAIYLGDDRRTVEDLRTQKNMVILKLAGTDDRNAAEALKGTDVFADEADLPELPEGHHYVKDVIGMAVSAEDSDFHGEVVNVIQNTAQDLFEVSTPGSKNVLIPNVDRYVAKIDAAKSEITVRRIEGLINL